ncbi:hypothetical protein ACS0TY_001195 [Phlomoides rotata]
MERKMRKVGLSLALESEEMDTEAVLTRSNRFDYHRIWSSEEEATSLPPPMTLYLFYEHYGWSKSSHSLYKIDIQFTPAITRAPSLVLDFPIEKYAARGMRCARLGSKIYFLGGTDERGPDGPFLDPREVYVLELLTGEFKPMTARLNAGKPCHSTVFAANGKVYALAMIPYCPNMSSADRLSLSLFECFDPSTDGWQVLDNLPTRTTDKGVYWMGCTVLEKRQEVVLLGREYPNLDHALAKFVYNVRESKWTRHSLGMDLEGPVTLSFQEGGDGDDYLYGLGYMAPPLKSISGYISFFDEAALYRSYPIDGFAMMSIPNTPTPKDDWPNPHGPDAYGDLDSDPFSRGILITLFKELKMKNQGGGEEKLCFQAEILHSQDYVIKSPEDEKFFNDAELVGCFVVNHASLPKASGFQSVRSRSGILVLAKLWLEFFGVLGLQWLLFFLTCICVLYTVSGATAKATRQEKQQRAVIWRYQRLMLLPFMFSLLNSQSIVLLRIFALCEEEGQNSRGEW